MAKRGRRPQRKAPLPQSTPIGSLKTEGVENRSTQQVSASGRSRFSRKADRTRLDLTGVETQSETEEEQSEDVEVISEGLETQSKESGAEEARIVHKPKSLPTTTVVDRLKNEGESSRKWSDIVNDDYPALPAYTYEFEKMEVVGKLKEAAEESLDKLQIATGEIQREKQKVWAEVTRANRLPNHGMSMEYIPPNIVDGEPEIEIEKEDVEDEVKYWKHDSLSLQ